VVDVGDAEFPCNAVVDTSAIDTTSLDETYFVVIQGCTTIGFATGVVELARIAVTAAGRVEAPVTNMRSGLNYRYMRAYNDVGGTTPSINSTVFLSKR
jgi:hypothetical protein